MPQFQAMGETPAPAEMAAAPAQHVKTPDATPAPAGISAPGYFKWLMLLLFLVLVCLRGKFIFTYFRIRPQVAAVGEEEPPAENFFHRCAQCGKTEITSPDMDFRVAFNGEEYCSSHLPRAKAV